MSPKLSIAISRVLIAAMITLAAVCSRGNAQQPAATALDQAAADARAALQAGNPRQVIEILEPLLQYGTGNLQTYQLLGAAYESLGHEEQAVDYYSRALNLSKGDAYSQAGIRRICAVTMPQWLDADTVNSFFATIGEAPCTFQKLSIDANDVAWPQEITPARSALFTTGRLYPPDDVHRDPEHLTVSMDSLPDQWRFNRVIYGYLQNPQSNRYQLRFRVFHVSEFLSTHDLRPRAQWITQLLLRLTVYAEGAMNSRSRFARNNVIDVYITTAGSPAGEQPANHQECIYFLGSDVPRSEAEWARMVCHEFGHHVMPPVSGYQDAPEEWLGGDLGERLFMTWLCQAMNHGVAIPGLTAKAVHGYLDGTVVSEVDRFLQQGPAAAIAADKGKSGLDYLRGLMIFIERSHGPRFLKRCFDAAMHDAGQKYFMGDDLLSAYEKCITDQPEQVIAIRPCCPRVGDDMKSDLSNLFIADALATVVADKVQTFWTYLPAGHWTAELLLSGADSGTVTAGLGQLEDAQTVHLSNAAPAGYSFDLGNVATGWHTLRVVGATLSKPASLTQIILRAAHHEAQQGG